MGDVVAELANFDARRASDLHEAARQRPTALEWLKSHGGKPAKTTVPFPDAPDTGESNVGGAANE